MFEPQSIDNKPRRRQKQATRPPDEVSLISTVDDRVDGHIEPQSTYIHKPRRRQNEAALRHDLQHHWQVTNLGKLDSTARLRESYRKLVLLSSKSTRLC